MILLLSLCLNLDSLLAETQGNQIVWRHYMSSLQGEELQCCMFLLENIPRLDRLEMTAEMLDDHILHSLAFRAGLPDSVFFSGLLWYRSSVEPVSSFRGVLWEFWAESGIDDPQGMISWTEDSITVLPRRYLGGMNSPLQVLDSRSGTGEEIRVLQAASLRSLGYPVRTVFGWFRGLEGGEDSWLEVWEDGSWKPLRGDFGDLVLAVEKTGGEFLTENYTETFTLITAPPDTSEGEFMVSLNAPVAGRFLPLDWALNADTIHPGTGELLVMATRRLPSGAVEVWNTFLVGDPGDTLYWSWSGIVPPGR